MKVLKIFSLVVTFLLLLALPFAAVSASPGHALRAPSAVFDVGAFFGSIFTQTLINQLLTLLGLIILQLALSVALAIRNSLFEWKKLADFYQKLVLPYVIGWFAFIVVARIVVTEMLGPTYSVLVNDGVTWLSWLAVVASLAGKIVPTAKELYGPRIPFPTDGIDDDKPV